MSFKIKSEWEKNNIYNFKDIQSENKRNINIDKNINNIKYIFVLAGGLKHNGKVNDFVEIRLKKADSLYKTFISKGLKCKIIVFGGGTYHKPPFYNKNNYVIHESTSCAYYLNQYISKKNIYREWASYDTIANGFFAFLNFVIPLEIKEFTLITSEFHIERSTEIFNYFNLICCNNNIKINYISTYNKLDKDILTIRKEREKKSLEIFKINIVSKIKSLKDFTIWFYEEHNAYKSIIDYEENKEINQTY